LCSRAAPSEVLVSAPVREHAGEVAAFEAVEPLQLKGKSQPLETYRARAR
jgi:class 3 adenylate cyclase